MNLKKLTIEELKELRTSITKEMYSRLGFVESDYMEKMGDNLQETKALRKKLNE